MLSLLLCELARAPNVSSQLEWKDPDIDGLVQFLVTEKGFK